jgi:hypothetical protein
MSDALVIGPDHSRQCPEQATSRPTELAFTVQLGRQALRAWVRLIHRPGQKLTWEPIMLEGCNRLASRPRERKDGRHQPVGATGFEPATS